MSVLKRPALLAFLMPLILTACAGNSQGFLGIFVPPPITWNDTSWCTPIELKIALNKISRKFGPVKVHSTHRWPLENARKGGKKRSYHLTCRAIDFSVPGKPSEVVAYIRSLREVGGYSYYPRGFYHIDNGPRRTW